jgi:hypothetical protein
MARGLAERSALATILRMSPTKAPPYHLTARVNDLTETDVPNILTADQFVAGIVSVLALKNRKNFRLRDTELDEKFENAFEMLVEQEKTLGVAPNFTFFLDPIHGDSVSLRETLLAAKEKELISLNNPTFHTFEIKLDEERARRYLTKVPLSEEFLTAVVDRYFSA